MRCYLGFSALSFVLLVVYVLITGWVLDQIVRDNICTAATELKCRILKLPSISSAHSAVQGSSSSPELEFIEGQGDSSKTEHKQIEIWSKAAIGWYLWNSIFNARLEPKPGEPWSVGSRRFSGCTFTFRAGPGVVPNTVPADVRYLVLVLNGRTPEKVRTARVWLDLLPSLVLLRASAVVLHGAETADNSWIRPYLRAHGGAVDALFVTYDDPAVDDQDVFQWPLGVATYRGFPQGSFAVDAAARRRWRCNLMATVYPNSSRETLRDVLDGLQDHQCLVKTRDQWSASETADSAQEYVSSLLDSDLTLSPAGLSVESYRLYEAVSLGSVPVLERPPADQLRLLRRHRAPFIWLQHWSQLGALLSREAALSSQQRERRRRHLLRWYDQFKLNVRQRFVAVILSKFSARGEGDG